MGEIILHGDCLVNRATELHQLFLHLQSSETDETVEIDMSATGRCDISFFQLLCAASRSYAKNNKRIVLRSAPSSSVLNQFKKAGFDKACSACEVKTCLFKDAPGEIQD
jgi:ABC-type transporter Mla MlaB component